MAKNQKKSRLTKRGQFTLSEANGSLIIIIMAYVIRLQ